MPLKTKALAMRKKASPTVPPPTSLASFSVPEQGPSDTSKSAEPSRPQAQVTPANKWTMLTGKVSMASPQDRAEATVHDFPILHPVRFVGSVVPVFFHRVKSWSTDEILAKAGVSKARTHTRFTQV